MQNEIDSSQKINHPESTESSEEIPFANTRESMVLPSPFHLPSIGTPEVTQLKTGTADSEDDSVEGPEMITREWSNKETEKVPNNDNNSSNSHPLSIAPPPFQLKATSTLSHDFGSEDNPMVHDNQIVQRQTPAPAPRVPLPQETPPVNKEKESFLKKKYGPANIIPSTGLGGFEASYSPNNGNGILNISVSAKIRFADAMNVNKGIVKTDHDKLNTLANKANRLPPKAKAAFLAKYQWTSIEKTAKIKEYTTRLSEVAKMWGGAHTFFIDQDDWRDVKSSVNVVISVSGMGEANFEAAGGKDHLQITVVKSPPEDAMKIGAFVKNKNNNNKIEGEMVIADELKTVKYLNYKVRFSNNSALLSHSEIEKLTFIANKFKDSKTNNITNKIQLTGRASTTGKVEHNSKLAQKRVDAVFAKLKSLGLDGIESGRVNSENKGSEGADESADSRCVDIVIGSGDKQNVLAHEMGHVFGLYDEYLTKSGKAGEKTEHHDASEKVGGGPATIESNDSVMSNGNEVRKQHYATFGDALIKLTGNKPWKLS